jgi:flagellar biogenesis protein FliO
VVYVLIVGSMLAILALIAFTVYVLVAKVR